MQKQQLNQQKQVCHNPESTLPKTYFDLMEKVGSKGKYQRFMFFIFLLIYFVNGSVMLSTSFIFMNNRYACQELGLLTKECQESICDIGPPEQRKEYFVKNLEDIQSAATDYGSFMCEEEYQLDIIKGSPYFGSFLGYIIFSYISDNFGRRKTMMFSLGLGTLGTIIIAFGSNITMISIGMVMSGAGINVSGGMLFYFLSETVQNLKRQKYSVMIQVGYNIAAIIMTGLYYFIGSWRIIFILVTTLPAIVAFFFFILYVQESPKFLLKQLNKNALQSLNRIGYINYGLKDILTEQDLDNVRAEQTPTQTLKNAKVSPLDLFRYTSVRRTMILGILSSGIITNMYYGPTLIIDSIGFNTYATSLVIQCSQLLGYIPIYYYIEKVERKKAGIYLLLTIAISALIVALIKKPEGCNFCLQAIIEIIVIFIFRFAIAVEVMIYIVYCVELYPSRVVAIANGMLSLFGMTINTICPLILGSLERLGFNLMLYFFILAIGGCFIYFLLDQTVGKPIKTQIDQIQFAKNKAKSLRISYVESQKQILSSKKIH